MNSARILLCEDDLDNQRLLGLVLRKLGLSLDATDSGEGLLRALRTRSYDLLITDLRLPGMSGFEAIRQIRAGRAGSEHESMPIIVLSALAMDSDREAGLRAGADLYLTKPFDLKTIRRAVLRTLEGAAVPAA